MTLEEFRTAWRATPFRPFSIHTTDGRSFPVTDPGFVCRDPSGRTIVVNYGDELMEILDLSLVASIEFMPPAAASA